MNYAQLDDGSLLQHFAQTGQEEFFEELISRHGALVYGVSLRVLGQTQDAEDATQAVFLTLAEKAASLRGYRSIAGWLHQTAWNIARCARKAALCRKNREKGAPAMFSSDQADAAGTESAEWKNIKPLLDTELEALPEKYRVALILHHVEGRKQSDIAQLLGMTGGALSRRISRAEELLRERLVRRGVTFAPALLFPAIVQFGARPMPAALAKSTAHVIALTRMEGAAGTPFSSNVVALHKGAMQTMLIKKVAIAACILLAVLLTSGAAHAVINKGSSRNARPLASNATPASAASPVNERHAGGNIGGDEKDGPATPSATTAQNDPEISAWITQLGSQDSDERVAAMTNLRKAGEKARLALKSASETGAGEGKARATTLLGVLDTAAALRRIADETAKIKSYEADVDRMKLAGGIRVDGKGHIKAIPASQLYTMTMTSELQGMKISMRSFTDGKIAWNEMGAPMGIQVMKGKLTATRIEGMSLDLNAFTQDYDFVSSRTEVAQGRQMLMFTGMIRDDAYEVRQDPYADGYLPTKVINAHVDATTMLLSNYELADDKGVVTGTSIFTNVKLNGALDAAQFAYTPPADVQVWDMDDPKPATTESKPAEDAQRVVENTPVKQSANPASPSAQAKPNSTAELLQQIAAANKANTSFEADEENVMTMQGMTFTSKSHVLCIPGSHRYITDRTTKMNGMIDVPSHIVCDGTTIYDEESFPETGTKLRKTVLKMECKDRPNDEPSLDANKVKKAGEDGFEFTASREETVEGVKQYVLSAVMREHKANDKPSIFNQIKGKKFYTIVVDATDLLLRSVEIKDEKGVTFDLTKYTNVKRNVTIDDNVFLYSPPAGVKVTDLKEFGKKPEAPPTQPAKQSDF